MNNKPVRSVVICGLATLVAGGVYLTLPASMGELPRRTVAVFIIAALLWATEALPLYATSLCVIGLEILLLAEHGGLAPVGGLSYSTFLEPFASSVIVLFMGGFLLSRAVTRHGIDQVIAAAVLKPFIERPVMLIYAIMGITAFFSMWMSNTATAAMMLAIIAPLLRVMPRGDHYHRAVILAVPFGANIGGVGTPIGTPPNMVALAALRHAGFQISFLDWMLMALPLVLLLLLVAGAVLYWMFPCRNQLRAATVQAPVTLGWQGKTTMVILPLTMLCWLTMPWHGVEESVVAVIAAAALTALGLLDRQDVNSIDWDILLLMWGGLSLGVAMQTTGLLGYVTELPLLSNTGFLMAIIIAVLAMSLSTFMSNTAAANLLVPLAMAMSVDQRGTMAILVAISASFAMAMPISTPPNALAFATGRVPAWTMILAGGLVSLLALVVVLTGYGIMIPLVIKQ